MSRTPPAVSTRVRSPKLVSRIAVRQDGYLLHSGHTKAPTPGEGVSLEFIKRVSAVHCALFLLTNGDSSYLLEHFLVFSRAVLFRNTADMPPSDPASRLHRAFVHHTLLFDTLDEAQ